MTVAMPNAVSAQVAVQLARAAATGVAGFASSLLAVPQESSPEETNDGSPAEPADSICHLAMPPGTAPALCLVGAEMNRAPSSVTEIYNQYYGIGETFSGQPVDGGFAKLEEAGASWRNSYNNSQGQYFSKVKRIVLAVDARIKGGRSKESSLAEFDSMWSMEEVNQNATKMISKLQQCSLMKQTS